MKTIEVNPGEGYRWLDDSEQITHGDEIFRPMYNPMWLPVEKIATGAPFLPAAYYGWNVRRKIERANPIRTDVYVHADKDTMWELGEKLGLSEEALMMFRHAASEVKLTIEVDEQTGESTIIACDGKELKP